MRPASDKTGKRSRRYLSSPHNTGTRSNWPAASCTSEGKKLTQLSAETAGTIKIKIISVSPKFIAHKSNTNAPIVLRQPGRLKYVEVFWRNA